MSSHTPSFQIVHLPVKNPGVTDKAISVRADRWQLAKLRWRCAADNGTEFGFELEHPLKHGDIVLQDDNRSYRIEQTEEPVLVVEVKDHRNTGELAWNIGNLHQPVEMTDASLITVDDPAVRQLFEKLQIAFVSVNRVFEPVRSFGGHSHHHHHND